MTDRKRLTRRDSLKGIAAAGTVVGGATFGLSTAMAHDEGDEKEDDHGNETGGDGKDDGKENGDEDEADEDEADEDDGKDNDGKDDGESDEKHGEKDDGKEYDGKEKDDGKEDGKHENGTDHDEEDHDGKGKGHDEKGHEEEEHHDGKDHNDKDHDGKDVAKRIDLIPVCYETDGKNGDEKYGTFRVENHGKKDAKVGWERHCDGKRGDTSVAGGESAYFRVGLGNSGTATVSLYYDGKKIATADAETDTRCDCEE